MKTSKTKKIILTNRNTNASIQDFFKTTEKDSRVRTICDARSTYIQALKDRVKCFDHEESGNLLSTETTLKDFDAGAAALIGEHTKSNEKVDALFTERATSAKVDFDETEKIGCQQCMVWREKYLELKKSHLKLCVRHTDQLMKHDDLIAVATNSLSLNSVEVASVPSKILAKVAKGSSRVKSGERALEFSETLPEVATSSNVKVASAACKQLSSSDSVFTGNEVGNLQGMPKVAMGSSPMNYDESALEVYETLPEFATSRYVKVVSVASKQLSSSDNVFTENEVIHLRKMPLEKTKDSTFVLKCIEYAYKNRTAELPQRTLKGTRDRFEVKGGVPTVVRKSKDPLTPEKVRRIEQLFIERIAKSNCPSGEFAERIQPVYVNRLIASAIKNMANKEQPLVTKSTGNDELNL